MIKLSEKWYFVFGRSWYKVLIVLSIMVVFCTTCTGILLQTPMIVYASEPTNTWQEALTDRTSNIGVASEGYGDSPYTDTHTYRGTIINTITSGLQNNGGTIYVGGSTLKYAYLDITFWKGNVPIRITSSDENAQNRLIKSTYSDWILEDGIAPNGAIKIDNVELKLNEAIESQKFELYGRGNKIVIGENVNTDHIMANSPGYIYGGSRSNDSTTKDVPTNVVVTSGRWGLVMGGGGADTNGGTQVTIRDTAEVDIIYGGGIDEGDIKKGSSEHASSVYIEGGNVTEVYGGNQTTNTGIKVNGDIYIDVGGGQVGTIHAGNDHRGVSGSAELEGSKVRGGAVVNIYNTGSVTNLIGDYMHYDSTYGDQILTFKSANGEYVTKGRHIRDLVELNVHSSNDFGMMDYWDVIRIQNLNADAEPESVIVSSKQDLVGVGNAASSIGSMYIGRMEVTNGGKLYLKNNCFINYMNEVSTASEEGIESFALSHAWMGETTEDRQAWSTLAVEGSCIQPSTAEVNLFSLENPCDDGRAGLRIKGNVEGFSTLEACGTPMYSTEDTYYYYVVADGSENGGSAFKEPEGAPYIVCYRELEDGRIGWYLRERPVITTETILNVKKIITDENPDLEAEFEFLLTYQNVDENDQVTTHEETFVLKHGETQDLIVPWGTEITIKEMNQEGYLIPEAIMIKTPEEGEWSGEELEVVFYNIPGAELPSTGGAGTSIYTNRGILLMIGGILGLYMQMRKKKGNSL